VSINNSHFQDKMTSDQLLYFTKELNCDQDNEKFLLDRWKCTNLFAIQRCGCFYTISRTDKLRLPFAPLTGVNHLRHYSFCMSIVGWWNRGDICMVLWLKFISHAEPLTAITQDKDMCSTIYEVFPQTWHHFSSPNLFIWRRYWIHT